MEKLNSGLILHNWQRKCVAILTAIVMWFFVNHSITETKTIPNVPIRIVNLPPDKTIRGLLPNRLLSKRVTLTLSGTKDVIQEIEPGDLEVLLDVSTADQDEWIVQIGKKNLVSLNPSIDLQHNITQVTHNEFVLKLSRLVTEKIPIRILYPTGQAPVNYEFLNIWPQKLMQTLSGPEDEIQNIKAQGLEIIFDLNEVTKSDLDHMTSSLFAPHNDEVSFFIPRKWQKVWIPFSNTYEEINDPEAESLRIDFLRKEILPLQKEIPIRVYYPLQYSNTLNPKTYPLSHNEMVLQKNGINILSTPLYARDVSQLFLDIIKDYLEIIIIASPKNERELLQWSLEIINPHELENTYIAFLVAHLAEENGGESILSKKNEYMFRQRFRDYIYRLSLYISNDQKFHLESFLEKDSITVRTVL